MVLLPTLLLSHDSKLRKDARAACCLNKTIFATWTIVRWFNDALRAVSLIDHPYFGVIIFD